MRAKHKYNKHTKEGARRIAQSYGYRPHLMDNPLLMTMLEKVGVYDMYEKMSDSDKVIL